MKDNWQCEISCYDCHECQWRFDCEHDWMEGIGVTGGGLNLQPKERNGRKSQRIDSTHSNGRFLPSPYAYPANRNTLKFIHQESSINKHF